MPMLWMVTQDGRPTVHRAVSKAEAMAKAEYLANGFWRKRAYDNRRLPEWEVVPDTEAMSADAANYRRFKEAK